MTRIKSGADFFTIDAPFEKGAPCIVCHCAHRGRHAPRLRTMPSWGTPVQVPASKSDSIVKQPAEATLRRRVQRGRGGSPFVLARLRAGPAGGSAFYRTIIIMSITFIKKQKPSDHSERDQVGLQNGFLLHTLILVLLAHAHDRTQRLDVEPISLRLRVDVADVVGDCLLFLLQALDAL